MLLDDLLADSGAEPRAFVRRQVGAVEDFENTLG